MMLPPLPLRGRPVVSRNSKDRDRNESPAIRTRALQLVGDRVQTDTSFGKDVAGIVLDTNEPGSLRSEGVIQLSRSSFSMHDQPSQFVAALRLVASDPDPQIRRHAIRALADKEVLRMLESGLETGSSPLPPSEAATLLGLVDPAPYFDLFRKLEPQPPDQATRLVAIRRLARDQQSRGALGKILRDRNESAEARDAALSALAAGDPSGFPSAVVEVISDESEPVDLRIKAIKAVEISRTSRDPKIYGRSADAFDRAVERLAASSPNAAVQQAARIFLDRTKSPR
jgi:HEAT repeat protein